MPCTSVVRCFPWDQPPPSETSNQGHSKLNVPPPPNVVPGNKPSGSPVVPRAHNGLEQPSLRPSARQSMSALAPGVVPYFGRFSRAACPGLCRCSQPSLGDGGMIGRPRNKPSHPTRDLRPGEKKDHSPNPGSPESGNSRRGISGHPRVLTPRPGLSMLRNVAHRTQLPTRAQLCPDFGGSSLSRSADQPAQDSAQDSSFTGHGIAVVLALALRPRPTTATTGTSGSARSIADLASCRGLRPSFHGTAAPSPGLHGTRDASAYSLGPPDLLVLGFLAACSTSPSALMSG